MQHVEGIVDYEQLRQSAAEFEIGGNSYASPAWTISSP
jgi:hypothetical protein